MKRPLVAVAVVVTVLLAVIAGCGGRPPPPPRGVVEDDIGDWRFRRYQPVLDVEVWVPQTEAVGYTATYVRGEAEKTNHLADADIVSAFVTRYDKDAGVLRETVKFIRRLAQESGYTVEETRISGVRVVLVEGHGETWALWSAARHVVKIGGRGRDGVPGSIVELYGERYPSTLTASILEGPLPPGPEAAPSGDPDAPYDADNPRPDWDQYDPEKAKPPAKKDDD